MGWVKDFDTMFITKDEEACINTCYDKILDIQDSLNKELRNMLKNI